MIWSQSKISPKAPSPEDGSHLFNCLVDLVVLRLIHRMRTMQLTPFDWIRWSMWISNSSRRSSKSLGSWRSQWRSLAGDQGWDDQGGFCLKIGRPKIPLVHHFPTTLLCIYIYIILYKIHNIILYIYVYVNIYIYTCLCVYIYIHTYVYAFFVGLSH